VALRQFQKYLLVPVRSIKAARGFLKGIDTEVARNDDRE
jgi:hypothetical protein